MEDHSWQILKEKDLLEKRISDLGLTIEGTFIQKLTEKLHHELSMKGLPLFPPVFLADEWFCPVGVSVIGVPFYLASRRLRSLEHKYILEVEGGTKSEFMKLIRHETGHAYSYAYKLYHKKKWRKIFGSATDDYPDTYRPRPYSRAYVIHLDNWYAQSHPDEDFAETFAVWLTPGINWKRRYRSWKALEKLNYVDQIMKSISGSSSPKQARLKLHQYAGLNIKLKTYFHRKRKLYEESYPDLYDNDLKTLFTDVPEECSGVKSHTYLRTSQSRLLQSVAYWTKEKKYTIDQLIKELISRTRDLNLYVRKNVPDLDFQTASFITSLVTNYLFTGKFKRSK